MAPYCHLFSLDPDPVRSVEDGGEDEANRRHGCPLGLSRPDCRRNAARNGVLRLMLVSRLWTMPSQVVPNSWIIALDVVVNDVNRGHYYITIP